MNTINILKKLMSNGAIGGFGLSEGKGAIVLKDGKAIPLEVKGDQTYLDGKLVEGDLEVYLKEMSE